MGFPMFTIKARVVLACHFAASVSGDACPGGDVVGAGVMLLQTEFHVQNEQSLDFAGDRLLQPQEQVQVEHYAQDRNRSDHVPRTAGWDVWQSRLPDLVCAGNATSNEDKARIWTALGEDWWMQFIDGKNHSGGKHVFDNTNMNHDGKFLQYISNEYERWSVPSAWGKRWTADSMSLLNLRLRGSNCTDPGASSSCAVTYSVYEPFGQFVGRRDDDGNVVDGRFDPYH